MKFLNTNYKKQYHSLTQDKFILVNQKPLNCQRHTIRTGRYYCGKIYLPSTEFNTLIGIQYNFVNFHFMNYFAPKSFWGNTVGIFVPFDISSGSLEKVNSEGKWYSVSATQNKILSHSKKSGGKIYNCGKLLLNKKFIGKKVFIFKFKNFVSMNYSKDKKVSGQFYLLSIENCRKDWINIFRNLKRTEVLQMLNSNMKIYLIAQKMNISNDAIWNHIRSIYCKNEIDLSKMQQIIHDNVSYKIIQKLLKLFKSIDKTHNRYLRNLSSQSDSQRKIKLREFFRLESIESIQAKYYKLHGNYIPKNLLWCIKQSKIDFEDY